MILTGLGGGSPALPFNALQFNNAGVFGGSANLTWNGTTLKVGNTDTAIELYNFTPVVQLLSTVTGDTIQSGLNLELQVTPTDDATRYLGAQLGVVLQGTHDVERLWGVYLPNFHEANGDVTNALGMVGAYVDTALNGAGGAISNMRGVVSQLTINAGYTVARAAFFDSGDNYAFTGTATDVYGTYQGAMIPSGGGAITNQYAFYSTDMAGSATNAYYCWADSRGVYRVREDNVADGAGNPQAVPALYNPRFTKYTAGAANHERGVQQWVSNVYQMGAEAGGTGTLRGVQVIGASLTVPAALTVGAHLVTLTGALTRVGAHALTLTTTGATNVTLPTSGTLGDALVANPLSQFAATTSLQLKGVISDETGSGALVFATSPALVTPVLGVAAATTLTLGSGTISAPSIAFSANTDAGIYYNSGMALTIDGQEHIRIVAGGFTYHFANDFVIYNNLDFGSGLDIKLTREAAGTLGQHATTTPQIYRLYNTRTDASNYERLGFTWASNIARIGTAHAGSGTARVLNLDYGGTSTAAVSIPITSGAVTFGGGITTPGGAALHTTNTALNDGAAAALGTLSNAPTAGNPTKWIPINDNGTTRYMPAW